MPRDPASRQRGGWASLPVSFGVLESVEGRSAWRSRPGAARRRPGGELTALLGSWRVGSAATPMARLAEPPGARRGSPERAGRRRREVHRRPSSPCDRLRVTSAASPTRQHDRPGDQRSTPSVSRRDRGAARRCAAPGFEDRASRGRRCCSRRPVRDGRRSGHTRSHDPGSSPERSTALGPRAQGSIRRSAVLVARRPAGETQPGSRRRLTDRSGAVAGLDPACPPRASAVMPGRGLRDRGRRGSRRRPPVRPRRGGGRRRRCRRGRGARPSRARGRRAGAWRRRRGAGSARRGPRTPRGRRWRRSRRRCRRGRPPRGRSAAGGPAHRVEDRGHVERRDRAEVDDLDRDAVARPGPRRRRGLVHHARHRDDGDVAAGPHDRRPADRDEWSAGGCGPFMP